MKIHIEATVATFFGNRLPPDDDSKKWAVRQTASLLLFVSFKCSVPASGMIASDSVLFSEKQCLLGNGDKVSLSAFFSPCHRPMMLPPLKRAVD